jgi:YcxB-like protein
MEVRTDITRADVQALCRFAMRRMNKATGAPWRPAAIGFGFMLPIAFVWGLFGFELHLPSAIATLLFVSAFLWFYRRRVTSNVVSDESSAALGSKLVTLDDSGVGQTDARNAGSTRWEGVVGVEETADHIFLMIDRFAGYIVPKRCFSTAGEASQFVRFAREHLKPAPPA